MKKEVLFAILIGFAIGLTITYGIYRAQQSYKNLNQANNQTSQQQTKESLPKTPSHLIDITFPKNESVSEKNETQIKGITSPDSYVSAVSQNDQFLTQADSSGNFSLDVNLEQGANLITITSISASSITSTKDILITYNPPENNNPNLDKKTQEETNQEQDNNDQ